MIPYQKEEIRKGIARNPLQGMFPCSVFPAKNNIGLMILWSSLSLKLFSFGYACPNYNKGNEVKPNPAGPHQYMFSKSLLKKYRRNQLLPGLSR